MPVVRANHLKRSKFERDMADASATKVERVIHIKLAELHAEACDPAPTDASTAAGEL